jgi:hypothetical protein
MPSRVLLAEMVSTAMIGVYTPAVGDSTTDRRVRSFREVRRADPGQRSLGDIGFESAGAGPSRINRW